MRFNRSLTVEAERRVRSAALVGVLLGGISLFSALQTWRERHYLDEEILLSLADAVVVLLLAHRLSHPSVRAAWALLLLGCAGMAYSLWSGLPLLAVLPGAVGAAFYARAIPALRFLCAHPAPARSGAGPGDRLPPSASRA